MLGANPLVSHGSVLTAPRVRDQLLAIAERGGRVVRRPAPHRDRPPVRARADQAGRRRLAAALAAAGDLRGGPRRRRASWPVDPRRRPRARAAGAPPTRPRRRRPHRGAGRPVRALARDFAAADGAAAYGRTGSCLGRYGTVVAFLIDALNAVTGNLDRPGGAVFGRPPVSLDESASAPAWPPTARRARASATSRTCSATCRRR